MFDGYAVTRVPHLGHPFTDIGFCILRSELTEMNAVNFGIKCGQFIQRRNYINKMVMYLHVAMDAGLMDDEWNCDTGANDMTTRCTSIFSSFETTFRMRFH
jgi:hypothetical protein